MKYWAVVHPCVIYSELVYSRVLCMYILCNLSGERYGASTINTAKYDQVSQS